MTHGFVYTNGGTTFSAEKVMPPLFIAVITGVMITRVNP